MWPLIALRARGVGAGNPRAHRAGARRALRAHRVDRRCAGVRISTEKKARSVDRDLAPAGRVARAAEHAFGAEVHDDLPVATDRDEAAVPAEPCAAGTRSETRSPRCSDPSCSWRSAVRK